MEAQPLSMEHHPNENNTTQVTFLDQGYCLLSMQTNAPLTESVKEVGGDHEMKEMMVEVQLNGDAGNFSLLEPANVGHSGGLYDKPLSCFGCGIGWFS
ncbi:hypothetical protein FH972_006322 [Carpinus fangiana]|uniref:Uncharacterized protein n=1 Tax=Carpinus fangiana TaxID=176857 RepID=A0A5N6QRX6_9ROSI|nr:hypothetical protein FH972_006322 [Carpinus fangiana]